jgi:hypothetical protein
MAGPVASLSRIPANEKQRYDRFIRAHAEVASDAFAAAAERGRRMNTGDIYKYALDTANA